MRKAPPAPEHGNEDPFAELTQIMGFDPRVPFRRGMGAPSAANAQPAAPQRVDPPSFDIADDDLDFSMELENELIGSLEAQAAGAASPAHELAPVPMAANDQPFADFEALDDLQLYDDLAVDGDPPLAPIRAAGEDVYASEPHSGYGQAAEPQWPEPSADPVAADGAYVAADDRYEADAYGDHALVDDLEGALSGSFAAGEEPGAGGDWQQAEPEAYAYEAEAAQQEVAASTDADEFAQDFDMAMADVDMDFSTSEVSEPAYAYEEAAPAASGNVREDAPAGDFDIFGPDPSAASFDAAAADDGLAVSPDPQASSAPAPGWQPIFGPAGAAEASVEEESVAQSEIDEAIAELAAMVRDYDQPVRTEPEQAVEGQAVAEAGNAAEILDIDTMDVPETAVALADDLDIPDVDYGEEPAPVFDDLDAELAAAFGEPVMETIQAASAPAGANDFDLDSAYEAPLQPGSGLADMPFAAAALPKGRSRNDIHVVRRVPLYQDPASEFEVERDPEDDLDFAEDVAAADRPPRRRGLMIASVVGGLAVVGLVGAFALSGGGVASREPALIKADTDPVKVKPTNPGGAAIPNQDSSVFDRAAGAKADQPSQSALIQTEEEPVDVASKFPDELPPPVDETDDIDDADLSAAPKGEDRIEAAAAADVPAEAADETVAVEPRKVRTMIVKPDGSLVARAEPPAANEASEAATAAKSLTKPALSQPQGETLEQIAAGQAADETGPAAETAASKKAKQASGGKAKAAGASVPEAGPVAPSRPAEQPIEIVGEVKPQQVAAAEAPAANAGSWSVQIASQPTQAAAQSSYEALARRYAGVLGGRSPSIVKAEIAGKGTFWRVRVPAGSRNDAISLCEKYKAAGGSCFVSK
ncbi:MAG: SPOR domain-containing protein [Rhizobiales bacterium]|nr:SPOR domain-containing protein [Hyphomicrobiales bacterium]